jgi:hypothetical protein
MRLDDSRSWRAWKDFAHRLALFQARVVLTLLYFTVLLPFVVLARMATSPFSARGWCAHDETSLPARDSAWKQS